MADKRTIAELAQDKAYLETCLREVNAEIARRAGQTDPPESESDNRVETATDSAVEGRERATE
ncbi:hypothetical protein E4P42_00445 [Mycobacterium sp. PS03-16]|uniref:hypothetical protein n=1 Tax=Mycobacterium sp. PS03-16 TaxID=2559611 RepID=UPI00107449B5|nr:hypothetical protein [Mycobacterium sp. PS03-16]TFV61406.1 hypothetical protein E4P42_00445 [Mycobacterium sp. PS03-16]